MRLSVSWLPYTHTVGPVRLITPLIQMTKGVKSFPFSSSFLKVAHSHCLNIVKALEMLTFHNGHPNSGRLLNTLPAKPMAFSHPVSASSDPDVFDKVDHMLLQEIPFMLCYLWDTYDSLFHLLLLLCIRLL